MVEWIPVGISVVALLVAGVSAGYSWRHLRATQDSTWLAQTLEFEAWVDNPNSGSATLVILYRAGLPLDEVQVELVKHDESPVIGFGVGFVTESGIWSIRDMQVGEQKSNGVVQRPTGGGWQAGTARVRVVCKRRNREPRQVAVDVEFPSEPTIRSLDR